MGGAKSPDAMNALGSRFAEAFDGGAGGPTPRGPMTRGETVMSAISDLQSTRAGRIAFGLEAGLHSMKAALGALQFGAPPLGPVVGAVSIANASRSLSGLGTRGLSRSLGISDVTARSILGDFLGLPQSEFDALAEAFGGIENAMAVEALNRESFESRTTEPGYGGGDFGGFGAGDIGTGGTGYGGP